MKITETYFSPCKNNFSSLVPKNKVTEIIFATSGENEMHFEPNYINYFQNNLFSPLVAKF